MKKWKALLALLLVAALVCLVFAACAKTVNKTPSTHTASDTPD